MRWLVRGALLAVAVCLALLPSVFPSPISEMATTHPSLVEARQSDLRGSSASLLDLPTTLHPFPAALETLSYPAFDANGRPLPPQSWLVVSGTGNSYENYLGSTSTGRLLNFGGTYLRFSDDTGRNWTEVRSKIPILSAEGAVVTAPGGDILGVTWDPWTGDRVVAFKYTAAGKTWSSMEVPLHTPFFDRPWIAVLTGPFTIAGQTAPYVSVIKGGHPSKDLWLYSLDGLTYALPENGLVDTLLHSTRREWVAAEVHPDQDWNQPLTETGITPLGTRAAMASGEGALASLCDWSTLNADLSWSCHVLPSGTLPAGRLLADSKGRLHVVDPKTSYFAYQVSSDGGRTWNARNIGWPAGYEVEDYDFKVNGALDLAAVALHTHRASTNTDQDFVYRFNVSTGVPTLTKQYHVGNGDADAGSGLGRAVRFDFASITILRDGKLAVSFLDAGHLKPAIAVEL